MAIAGRTATVTDAGDTDPSTFTASYVIVASEVSEGTASISIAFRDLASNPGVTVTSVTDASAVTIDLTAPTLTTVTMSSDNAGYASRANTGDKITVVIKSNEAIVAPTVLVAGQNAAVSGSGTSYTATYTVLASDTGLDGTTASVSVAFVDIAGNAGATVTALTSGSGVTIDLTAPKLTTVTMVSNNAGNGTLANAGDTITVSLTADEAIVAPTVTIAGQSATVSGSGTSYTAGYTPCRPARRRAWMARQLGCLWCLPTSQATVEHR